MNRIVLFSSLIFCAITLAAADGRIPISAVPYTINAPGAYYLTQDLTLPSGTAITINASRVTLDLNGHTLATTATAVGNTVISSAGFSGLRITGGHVTGGNYGINLSASAGGAFQVDHLEASGSAAVVIYIYSTVPAVPIQAVVDAVHVSGCAGAAGVDLEFISGGRITGSSSRGCGYGIILQSSRNLIIADNTASDNTNSGISLGFNAQNNILTRNNASNNSNYGISLNPGAGNQITHNTLNANSLGGISLGGSSNNNTLSDNILIGNAIYGIQVLGANRNSIARNSISGTTGVPGTGIILQSGSTNNSIDWNVVSGNAGPGLNFSDAASSGSLYSYNRFMGNTGANNYGSGNVSAGGNNAGAANF